MSQFPHQREKKLEEKSTSNIPCQQTDQKNPPILISPSVPNSPDAWDCKEATSKSKFNMAWSNHPAPTPRSQATHCFIFKILDANESVLASTKKKPSWWRKQVTWVIIAVYVFICSRVVQAPWRMPHAIGIFIAGHLASMPTFAIWVYNFPTTHPACHEIICWSVESNPNETRSEVKCPSSTAWWSMQPFLVPGIFHLRGCPAWSNTQFAHLKNPSLEWPFLGS